MEESFILKRGKVLICLMLVMTLLFGVFAPAQTYAAKKPKKAQDKIIKIAKSKRGKGKGAFPKWFTGGAWCSDFVWWSAKKAKVMNGDTFPKKKVGGSKSIENWFKKKKRYKKATKKVKPKKGDVAIFSGSGHVGLVAKVKGNKVYIIHGNWGNKVKLTKMKKAGYDSNASGKIKGYGRPDYRSANPIVIKEKKKTKKNARKGFAKINKSNDALTQSK